MSRLIDADKLYDYISDVFAEFGHEVMNVKDALEAVENAPTVNAIEFPCKVGDMVYIITTISCAIKHTKVIGIWSYKGNTTIITELGGIQPDAWGETVFLTREEAEKALEGVR